MKIIRIEEPILYGSPENNILYLSMDNFEIVQSLNAGDSIIIENKGNPGSVTLEILDK